MPEKNTFRIEKILIIGLFGIGDFLLIVPSIKALRRRYPNAKIHYLAQTAQMLEFANHLRFFDKLILSKTSATVDKRRGLNNALFFIGALEDSVNLRKGKYDVAVWPVAGITWKMDLMLFAIHAKVRPIFKRGAGLFRGLSVNDAISFSSGLSRAENEAALFRAVGVSSIDLSDYLITLSEDSHRFSSPYMELVSKISKYVGLRVGVQPFAKQFFNTGRDYPVEQYKILIREILRRYKDSIIVLIDNQIEMLETNFADMESDRVVMANSLSLLEIAFLVKKLNLVIGGDSGIPHLANALGVTSIMIHGPTAPWSSGLLGNRNNCVRIDIPCSPCWEVDRAISERCEHKSCFKLLSPEMILRKIADTIDAGEQGTAVEHKQYSGL
jgi:heptosyltransferase-1